MDLSGEWTCQPIGPVKAFVSSNDVSSRQPRYEMSSCRVDTARAVRRSVRLRSEGFTSVTTGLRLIPQSIIGLLKARLWMMVSSPSFYPSQYVANFVAKHDKKAVPCEIRLTSSTSTSRRKESQSIIDTDISRFNPFQAITQ